MHSAISRGFLGVCLSLVLVTQAAGQEHPAVERGFSADKVYHFASTDLDQVNLFSGGLTLALPIGGSYPVGGALSYSLTLTYSSKFWDFEEGSNMPGSTWIRSIPGRHANAGLGFMLSLGRLIPPGDPSNETTRWQYLSPDGSRHSFYPVLHPTDPVVAGVSYSRDSTYLRLKELANGKRTVEFPNGSFHTFKAGGRIERIEDRYGNFLNVTYPDALTWRLSDRHGRRHHVRFKNRVSDGVSVAMVDKVELAAFNGTTSTYEFVYEATSVHPACSDTFHNVPGTTISVQQLKKLRLPDGSLYEMGYQFASCGDGVLTSLTLPTLGRIEYGYRPWQLPTEGCNLGGVTLWAQSSPGVARRALVDANGVEQGAWIYNQQLHTSTTQTGQCLGDEDPAELSVTTVSSPLGHKTAHYFSVWPNAFPLSGSPGGFRVEEYGLPINRLITDATSTRFLSSETLDCGAQGCTKLRSTYLRYEYEKPCLTVETLQCDDSNRRQSSQRTVYHDDANQAGVEKYADTTFSDFDGLGHYRTATTGGNFAAGNVRTTFTNYNPGHDLVLNANMGVESGYVMWSANDPWVLETSTEQRVSEGGVTAKTQTCFNADTGFLERTRTMLGTSPNPRDLITLFEASPRGDLASESYFGGDTQAVSTSSNLCALPLGAAQYRLAHTYSSGSRATSRYTDAAGAGIGFVSVNLTIDPNTGLPSSSTDPAGLRTHFEYDSMGRPEWEKPQAGHGVWAQYVYHNATATTAARVQALRRANGSESGAILSQEEYRFDDFGRVAKERRLMPGGVDWVVLETRYDALGQPTQISEWADESLTPAVRHWTRYLDYDAFGRPKTIRPPDGAGHDIRMIYAGERVTRRKVQIATSRTAQGAIIETESETKERYDRQGRLHQVVEPSGANGANVTTTYTYDIGNRLSRVRTVSAGVAQVRTFNYDHRGFLRSETHPEKDGAISYSGYNARGHAGRKIDGPSDLTLTYDLAERLLKIRETGGARRPLKTFQYATAIAANNWKKGKLERATRYNYYSLRLPPPAHQIFSDGFECGDLSGWSEIVGASSTPQPQKAFCVSYDVAVQETYTYGGVGGRVSKRDLALQVDDAAGETFTQGWSYNQIGQVASITYPRCNFSRCTADGAGTSRTVSFNYARGYLSAVPGYASSITYHPNGLAHKVTHANGVQVTQAADPHGMARIASITAKKGTTTHWATGTYKYDGVGNISKIGRGYYLYDKVRRLTTGAFPIDRLGTGSLKQQSYVYDAFGNLQSILGSPGLATPTSSATNRLRGSAVYGPAGNLTHWNGNVYQYDAFHMMKQMTSGAEDWLYVYTADDERVWQFKLGSTPVFHRYTLRDLSGQVLREYTSTGDFWEVERDYVYREGQLLSAVTQAGIRHFHLDHLGTPRLITNASGQRQAYHVYYPFGEEATNPSQNQERMKFTGHERDLANLSDNGDDLDYMHARFCSPWTGRFTSVDPIESANLKRPQSWNRFAYTHNNPVNQVDPDGRVSFLVGAIVGGLTDVGFQVATNVIQGKDPLESTGEAFLKGAVIGATGVGVFKVASKGFRLLRTAKTVDKVEDAGKQAIRASEELSNQARALEASGRGTQLSREAQKSISSLERQIAKHEKKLADFRANPTVRPGMENLPRDLIRQQQTRRIQHLEAEIQTFRSNIDKILRGEL